MSEVLRILWTEARDFRNLSADRIIWNPGRNLLLGRNGEGKTNILEALTVAGNLRSFRSSKLRRVVRHECSTFGLGVAFECGGRQSNLHQVVHVGPPVERHLSIDRQPVAVAEYLSCLPIFTLGPEDAQLVSGAPEHRRAFIDRLAFLLDQRYLEELRLYRRVLRQRNAALAREASDDELCGWEHQLARGAAVVCRRRQAAVAAWCPDFTAVYETLRGEAFPEITITYRGDPWLQETHKNLEETYCQRYNETRVRDRRAGFTLEGPHRHDLVLRAEERPVRDLLSSGQTKIVAAALRLATMVQVEKVRGEILPLVIDDVDAALDAVSVESLMRWVGGERQVFLSSAHDESMQLAEITRFRVQNGRCRLLAESGETT